MTGKESAMPANNTMYEYLSWRGDLTFAADPFNEVDNLILAQLSYVDFDGIVPEDGENKIEIGEACRLYWLMHTEEEIRSRESFVKLAPFLLEPVAESRRFRGTKLSGYVNNINKDAQAQMSAIRFELEDGTIYVAFRGTDETLIGWKEDFNLSFMSRTEGHRLAVEYLRNHFLNTDLRLRVGGHSKGGNFAVYASAFAGPEVERQIFEVYTNDGPGFQEEITKTEEYHRILSKVISIIPGESVIGCLLDSNFTPCVVKSSAFGIMQHDAMTWQVMGNRFVRTERSENSIFFEKVITEWLDKVNDERAIVDQIFGILFATGADTIKEVKSSDLRGFFEMFQSAKNLPKEDKKEITQAFSELFRTGERTFYEQIENIDRNIPDFIRRWAAKKGDAIDKKEDSLEQKAIEQSIEEKSTTGQSEQEPIAEEESGAEEA